MPPDPLPELMSWTEIVDTCSRLHTTRTRPVGPWPDAELREGSKMIDVTVDGRPAQIVPTRMHEPGLYWRYMDIPDGTMRSDVHIEMLKLAAEGGLVRHA